ncbi:hypothetical protein MNBD_GAMMA15-1914 [hydrothermal vent metagenome]|uniref:Uncharacterized protein n=1 Tax=hydrothermal vent metagenome TaxID=652676 RepID=A0A3B0YIF9_9ZZZZ
MKIPSKLPAFGLFLSMTLLSVTGCNEEFPDNAPVRVLAAELGSIVDARFGGEGLNLDGAQMAVAISKLLEVTNFSAAGTVRTTITLTSTGANPGDVDATLLSAFDIFFIGYLNDNSPNAFTAAELTAFQDWVNIGGILIVTCDEANYDAVCEAFGYPSTTAATPPTVPAATGIGHDSFAGSFGAVASIAMSGTSGFFATTTDAIILGEDSAVAPNATFLEKQVGLGTVIFLSDVDMISDNTLSAGTGFTNDNDRFLGNLFEYVTGLL